MPWNEPDLAELLELVSGKGKWKHLGGGFTTYPGHEDDGKHEACLELERRGLVKRWVCSTDEAVTWVDVNKPDWVDPDNYPTVRAGMMHYVGNRFVRMTPIITPAKNDLKTSRQSMTECG